MAALNGSDGKRRHYKFRCFTGNEYVQQKDAKPYKKVTGNEGEEQGLVGGWRVGSIMDNNLGKAGTGGDHLMTVNVCIEWWGRERFAEEYGEDEVSE